MTAWGSVRCVPHAENSESPGVATHELAVWRVDAGAKDVCVHEVARAQLLGAPTHVALISSKGALQLVTTGPSKLQFWALAEGADTRLVPEQHHLQAHTDFKQRVRGCLWMLLTSQVYSAKYSQIVCIPACG